MGTVKVRTLTRLLYYRGCGRSLILSVALGELAFVYGSSAFGASLPASGHYVGGGGSFRSTVGGLTVDQKSTRGIIDWQSFSIGRGQTVQFDNGSGATLNEVTGSNLSRIAGSLKATGSVYLVNQNGIIVMPGGKVIAPGGFGANSRGNVVNDGSISASNGG